MTPVPSDPAEDQVRPAPRVEPPAPPNGAPPAPSNGAPPAPPNGEVHLPAETALGPPGPAPPPGPAAAEPARAAAGVPDSGLYAILGVNPRVSDAEIQVAYRRKAARLARKYTRGGRELRQLNAAYEVLGNPTRRAEYDRSVHAPAPASAVPPAAPAAARPVAAAPTPVPPRHRTGRSTPVGNSGWAELLAVVAVVGLAIGAALYVIPRVSVDLSALNVLSNVLALGPSPRRVAVDAVVTPAPSATARVAATATPAATLAPTPAAAGLADHFQGSTVTMSSSSPAQNTPVSVLVKLVRDGQPAAGVDLYAQVRYRTTQERWPATGTVKTDANGAATITFNVGDATAGYAVDVVVYANVDGEQLSWSTSFTPH
jgi:DnaJ domain